MMSFRINYLFISICFLINVGFIIGIPLSDENDNKQLNHDNLPPLFFPNDTNLYKILPSDNQTALKILSHLMNNDDKKDIKLTKIPEKKDEDNDEVDYYTDYVDKKTVKSTLPTTTKIVTTTNANIDGTKKKDVDDDDDDIFSYDDVESDNPKLDVEGIQTDNKDKTLDELEENFHRSGNKEFNLPIDETLTVDLTTLHGGHIAGIFATAFVVISIIAYIILIIWRARLEKKYGNRERLVTEDDYYNNNDMRHFEL